MTFARNLRAVAREARESDGNSKHLETENLFSPPLQRPVLHSREVAIGDLV